MSARMQFRNRSNGSIFTTGPGPVADWLLASPRWTLITGLDTGDLDDFGAVTAALTALTARVLTLEAGGGGGGPVTAAAITDSGTAGRAVLTSETTAAARTAINAGTSSLALGTDSSTAKAGDYQPTWTQVSSKPTVVAAMADALSARNAIGFDPAARAAVPFGVMQWDSDTDTWWGYDPVTNAMVNGQARPGLPQGFVWYFCEHDATATAPTGAQAWQRSNLAKPGDHIIAHEQSPFYS